MLAPERSGVLRERRPTAFDPLLPFLIGPGTGEDRQKTAVGATSRMRQNRPFMGRDELLARR